MDGNELNLVNYEGNEFPQSPHPAGAPCAVTPWRSAPAAFPGCVRWSFTSRPSSSSPCPPNDPFCAEIPPDPICARPHCQPPLPPPGLRGTNPTPPEEKRAEKEGKQLFSTEGIASPPPGRADGGGCVGAMAAQAPCSAPRPQIDLHFIIFICININF